MSDPDFTKMLSDAGIPTTAADMQAKWDEINVDQGSLITNNSAWSPFWRLISAIVTSPCKWLVALLVGSILPNAFLKTATGIWLDLLAWAVDVTRKKAATAVGSCVFTRTNSAGELTIPAGTPVESPSINGYIYRLKTTAAVTIPDAVLSATAPVQAVAAGAAYNLGAGYYSILNPPVNGIASVTNTDAWLSTPGADEEDNDALRLRAKNQFSAVGQYHHDAAYKALISSFAGIRTDYLYFQHDAPRGPGSANCYLMLDSGAPSQNFVDAINAHITDSGNHGHGDSMICYPMPEKPYALAVEVWAQDSTDAATKEALRQSVENMIRGAFRENSNYAVTQTRPATRFSFSRLGSELHAQHAGLKSVAFSLQDIDSDIELPVLGSLIVTLGAD